MGSEIMIKVTLGDTGIRSGNKDPKEKGAVTYAPCSGSESSSFKHGHLVELYIHDFCPFLYVCSASSEI